MDEIKKEDAGSISLPLFPLMASPSFLCMLGLILFFFSFWGHSQARHQIGAAAAGLHHRHSNSGSEPHLVPTSQLAAVLDP